MAVEIIFPDGNKKSFDAPVTSLAIAQGIAPCIAISPPIDQTLFLLGRERTLARLAGAVNFVDSRAS